MIKNDKFHILFNLLALFVIIGCNQGTDEDHQASNIIQALLTNKQSFPEEIKDTALFKIGNSQAVTEVLRPYEPKIKAWDEDSRSEYFLFVPPDESIKLISKDNTFQFPKGTVFLQNIFEGKEKQISGSRISVLKTDGAWKFASYRWENSIAKLEKNSSGTACTSCHSANTIHHQAVLGFRLEQFDNPMLATRKKGQALAADQLYDFDLVSAVDAHSSLAHPNDRDRSLHEKARAYLHVNCAPCHEIERRSEKSLADLSYNQTPNLVLSDPQGYLSIADIEKSLVIKRMTQAENHMPPHLSKPDDAGIQILKTWIEELANPRASTPKGEEASQHNEFQNSAPDQQKPPVAAFVSEHLTKASEDLPLSLNDSGIFENNKILSPSPELVKFDVHVGLWTDGSLKQRYIFVPPGQKISLNDSKTDFVFPNGTMLVKQFSSSDESFKPIETRVIVKRNDGSWGFASYLWENSSSALNIYPKRITDSTGVEYRIPSKSECIQCHSISDRSSPILGFRPDQLNSAAPEMQVELERMKTNMQFDFDISTFLAGTKVMPHIDDTNVSVDLRARAYMDVHCATCHNPQGMAGMMNIDLRRDTKLGAMGLLDQKLLTPGSLIDSELWRRFSADTARMLH